MSRLAIRWTRSVDCEGFTGWRDVVKRDCSRRGAHETQCARVHVEDGRVGP